ncbi:MAG: acyl transferase [Saprospiraceae bacterium]|nr:acyl transferase [Saprospiraceae bacterium]
MAKDIELLTNEIRKKIIASDVFDFEKISQQVFALQRTHNPVFKTFVDQIQKVDELVFLPISSFKSHEVKTGDWVSSQLFKSSGTTGSTTSIHHVRDLVFYQNLCLQHFQEIFGNLENRCILALLPHYLERGDSSLVAMVNHLIQQSSINSSGFYLYDFEKLKSTILQNKAQNIPTILFGVTYALLEFSAFFGIELVEHLTIIETGGMKGRGKELTRMELHETLSKHFEKATITSEYGMTEMFSQAYLDKTGWFVPGKTLKIIITEINDPLSIEKIGKTGRVNIIDLGNVDTCAFIATDDLGMIDEQGKFQIMGRLDHSDLRGCNLMVQDLS